MAAAGCRRSGAGAQRGAQRRGARRWRRELVAVGRAGGEVAAQAPRRSARADRQGARPRPTTGSSAFEFDQAEAEQRATRPPPLEGEARAPGARHRDRAGARAARAIESPPTGWRSSALSISGRRATDMAVVDPNLEWLGYVQPVGLVVARPCSPAMASSPRSRRAPTAMRSPLPLARRTRRERLPTPGRSSREVLGWRAASGRGRAGRAAAAGRTVGRDRREPTPSSSRTGRSTDPEGGRQLLVRIEAPGVEPDQRGALDGWEATPHQRFERLLRENGGVPTGLLLTDGELRLVYAPHGETSGWLVLSAARARDRRRPADARRPEAAARRLPPAQRRARPAPAGAPASRAATRRPRSRPSSPSRCWARCTSCCAACMPPTERGSRRLPRERPEHLYEGLLTVLLRLVFLLYAEDRDLIPSRDRRDGARALRPGLRRARAPRQAHSTTRRAIPTRWTSAAAPGGGCSRCSASSTRATATAGSCGRGGKLFDPDAFPFLEGRDGCPDDRPAPRARLRRLHPAHPRRPADRSTASGSPTARSTSSRSARLRDGDGLHRRDAAGPGARDPRPARTTARRSSSISPRSPAKKGTDRAEVPEGGGRPRQAARQASAKALAAATDAGGARRRRCGRSSTSAARPAATLAPPGTPLLQPTDERRRTGSHYTPRSLTEPIVRHALEPAFERLGAGRDAGGGSGAQGLRPGHGLRRLPGRGLPAARRRGWCRPGRAGRRRGRRSRRTRTRSCTPAASSRSAASTASTRTRCAVDLAKLSLWLATLARDHEFTFLDHALKCGDSLVGLTPAQIAAAHWDTSKPGLPLFRKFVRGPRRRGDEGAREIQAAPDDTRARHPGAAASGAREAKLEPSRMLGDAVIAAFFAGQAEGARESAREVESWLAGIGSAKWDELARRRRDPAQGEHPHPAVPLGRSSFRRCSRARTPGFDAIVGNPPFAGKNTIIAGNRQNYLPGCRRCTRARTATPISSRISSAAPSAAAAGRRLRPDRHQHDRPGRHARHGLADDPRRRRRDHRAPHDG